MCVRLMRLIGAAVSSNSAAPLSVKWGPLQRSLPI